MNPIPLIDLQAQRAAISSKIDEAIQAVLSHGKFIMGPEVAALEAELATFAGVKHAIACSSGTDALLLSLMAYETGPGDAIVLPAFTFPATAEVVALLGATPVFVDVLNDSFNIDCKSVERAIADIKADGKLTPKGIIGVGLFGQPADYPELNRIAATEGMFVIDDAAQSFGASLKGQAVGGLTDITATSFFPAKPLGCYGDGGAVFTNDDDKADLVRSLLVHGKGNNKYDNVRIGLNARIDTLQAAILMVKLQIFADEIEARQKVADRYRVEIGNVVTVPALTEGATSVWAQYTVKCSDRDRLMNALREKQIASAIYYPRTMASQPAYEKYPVVSNGVPVSEHLTEEVLSIPMHPYISEEDQMRVISAVKEFVLN